MPYNGRELLNDLLHEVAQDRHHWREENGMPDIDRNDRNQVLREMLEEHKIILKRATRDRRILFQANLGAFWNVLSNGLWRFDEGYEDAKFRAWVEDNFYTEDEDDYDDLRYLRSQINVVENIFPPVFAAEQAGQPMVDPDGVIITVSRLIEQRGLVGKLKEWATRFGRADDAEQRTIIANIVSRSQGDMDVERRTQDNINPVNIKYRMRQVGDTVVYDIVLDEPLTEVQFNVMRRMNGRFITFIPE